MCHVWERANELNVQSVGGSQWIRCPDGRSEPRRGMYKTQERTNVGHRGVICGKLRSSKSQAVHHRPRVCDGILGWLVDGLFLYGVSRIMDDLIDFPCS